MKKLINLRFPLICAISLAIGVFCAYCLVRFNVHLGWALAISLIVSVLGTLFFIAEKKSKLIAVALCIFIFNVLGNALSYSRITAHFGTEFEDGKYYEYGACTYPEGLISSEQIFCFNHDKIAKVCYMGYETEAQKELCGLIQTGINAYQQELQSQESEA